jgi:hypothetical protein
MFLGIERAEEFGEVSPEFLRSSKLQIIIELLLLQFFNGLRIQILQHGLEMEVGFDFRLMRDRVDGEVEVIEGEVLAVICVFFEDDRESLEGEDGLEQFEVLGEEEERLDVDALMGGLREI